VRGATWARALLGAAVKAANAPRSVCVLDGTIAGVAYRAIAIVPDASARFPRARHGEFGLDEGLAVAEAVIGAPEDSAILSIVDAPGQAFGHREEAAGLALSLASATQAYIAERRRGRPLFTLIVGKAISGAFLAHGLQGGWIGTLDHSSVEVHVMSAPSVARVTRSSEVEALRIAELVPATARDIESFWNFGAIDDRFAVANPDSPTADELANVRSAIAAARQQGLGTRSPAERLANPRAARHRALALEVRRLVDASW
jgi:biotin-independent malonate decarboxylase gamma subunit